MASVADQILRALAANGVRRLHAAPGPNALDDAVARHPAIAWLRAGRMESAPFAAAGDAAMSGELAVCVARSDPADDRLRDGLSDARLSGVPVLMLALPADAGTTRHGRSDLAPAYGTFAETLTSPGDLPRLLTAAIRAAVEDDGVAVVVVDETMLGELCDVGSPMPVSSTRPVVRPREPDLAAAARVLTGAGRTTIVAGAGAAAARNEIEQLADILRAPVAHTLRGKEHVEGGSFDVGMVGPIAGGLADDTVAASDVVLLLGTDLRYRPPHPDDATVIQIDSRGSHLGRRFPVDLALNGTVLDTLHALQPRLERHFDTRHLDVAVAGYASARRADDARALDHRDSAMASVAVLVNRLAEPDAVFAVDTGFDELTATRHLRMNGERRLIGSFTRGSAQGVLPLALGAQSAHGDRQVVALLGDRGRARLSEELPALVGGGLPLKIVAVGRDHDPALTTRARALGMSSIHVDRAHALGDAIIDALDYDGPALVEFARGSAD